MQVPSKVTGLVLSKAVSSGAPALRVIWSTPQSDVPISQYHMQYRMNGTTTWGSNNVSGSPPPTSAVLPGLNAGTEYNVRVRAVSAVGVGYLSTWQTERTYMSEVFFK